MEIGQVYERVPSVLLKLFLLGISSIILFMLVISTIPFLWIKAIPKFLDKIARIIDFICEI